MRRDLIIKLSAWLVTDNGKEVLTEKSNDFVDGLTGYPREIADILALEEMTQTIDEDFKFRDVDELSTRIDARDILFGIDQEDIMETIEPLFRDAE